MELDTPQEDLHASDQLSGPEGIRVLILQHPQEARNPYTTAPLVPEVLPRAKVKVGLSWSGLKKAWNGDPGPQPWGVLYVGTRKKTPDFAPGQQAMFLGPRDQPLEPPPPLGGLILLDGNWKQSKTLWWRNPWLLKLTRIVLNPQLPSRFGKLRRQPRGNCVSTLEAVALILNLLTGDDSASRRLEARLTEHLENLEKHPPSP